ncbi:structural protein [Edwardsiella phage eiAU-183]|uniref:Structural protein n=3 Tax=Viruses TaxID=10239 RepID=W0LM40_9CAUD|nr:major head protein [Edwardsiella phage eiAU-183]YP_009613896.1 major head protein [Edwardsiella phage eiAU]ADV36479.1 phage structural protein [Edwardsiella phage eiDWF]AHG23462.1 structural protein [Edwardsiella phage eiAU]AHG23516.1 structural protein [Edwardsiella phage eiAU-183]
MSLPVFQEKLIGTTIQLVADNLNVWNASSGGAIVMGSGTVLKDVIEKVTVGIIDGLVSDRNAYAPVGTAADAKVLARMLTNSINLSAKVGPVAITSGMMAKIQTDVNQTAGEVSALATEAIIQHYIKGAVGAVGGALCSNAASQYTQPARVNVTATGMKFPTLADFPLAASLFGDAAGNIKTWAMSGTQWAQFIAYQAVPSAEKVFAIGNIEVLQDGLGRRFLISDAVGTALADVIASSTSTKLGPDAIIGLVPGAVAITTTGLDMLAEQKGGNENIERWWQGEFDFNVAVKGYRIKSSLRTEIEGLRSAKLADVSSYKNWELDQGAVDNAPVKNTGGSQKVPVKNLKETAGVLMKLTATTAGAAV